MYNISSFGYNTVASLSLLQGMDVVAFKSRLSSVKKEIFEMHSFYARKVMWEDPSDVEILSFFIEVAVFPVSLSFLWNKIFLA